jgi:hypothetical protein
MSGAIFPYVVASLALAVALAAAGAELALRLRDRLQARREAARTSRAMLVDVNAPGGLMDLWVMLRDEDRRALLAFGNALTERHGTRHEDDAPQAADSLSPVVRDEDLTHVGHLVDVSFSPGVYTVDRAEAALAGIQAPTTDDGQQPIHVAMDASCVCRVVRDTVLASPPPPPMDRVTVVAPPPRTTVVAPAGYQATVDPTCSVCTRPISLDDSAASDGTATWHSRCMPRMASA